MRTNKPAVIALVLWLVFVASNVFAVLRPLYPAKAYPPDQISIVGNGTEMRTYGTRVTRNSVRALRGCEIDGYSA